MSVSGSKEAALLHLCSTITLLLLYCTTGMLRLLLYRTILQFLYFLTGVLLFVQYITGILILLWHTKSVPYVTVIIDGDRDVFSDRGASLKTSVEVLHEAVLIFTSNVVQQYLILNMSGDSTFTPRQTASSKMPRQTA